MNNHIYIISGLGADERVFQKLDFRGLTVTYINWIIPLQKETIESYAKRLLSQIETLNPTLIGLSFGGLIAIEIAKQIETKKVILIASAKTRKEIPFYFRIAGQINIHKFIPTKVFKKSNFLTNWFFGVKSSFDKELLKVILKDTNPIFMKWAIDKVVCWTNQTSLNNIIHIHGTADRIFPIEFVNFNFKVINGGHFMTLNKYEELSKLLLENV